MTHEYTILSKETPEEKERFDAAGRAPLHQKTTGRPSFKASQHFQNIRIWRTGSLTGIIAGTLLLPILLGFAIIAFTFAGTLMLAGWGAKKLLQQRSG